MTDLLLELGCEDLPARYVMPLADALAQGIRAGLIKRGITPAATASFATPRRIAVKLAGVAARQPDQAIERKGPALAAAFKDGAPTPAALGFARSCGVAFEVLAQDGGTLVFRKQQPGKATAELLPEIFEETLKAMDELVPKRMRWGAGTETFVRPVQWIVALLGDAIVPLRRFGLDAGRLTYGHRFHAPAAISLASPADYAPGLLAAKVWSDVASRKAEIRRQIVAEAAKLGGSARISSELLDEVTALVEWPVVISGRIEERFLQLPAEVIVATVETNQRYFTVFDAAGKLMPAFITISNIESRDVALVIQGNERVVRPRLSDALFFWDQDLKQPLSAHAEKLAQTMFQKDLGSVADKVQRVRELAALIVAAIPGAPAPLGAEVDRAAELAKADLVTKIVFEFPELQGLMGGYYAAKSGENAAVSHAIREHYLPTQQGTPIPSTPVGRVLSLADKLDTLAGIFAIGQKPSASKDPYALRRAAVGVVRILVEGELELDLRVLLRAALALQPAGARGEEIAEELWAFCLERLRSYSADRGASPEAFEAVRATGASVPLDFERRLQALLGFLPTPEAASLAAADKRARNILRQAGVTVHQLVQAERLDHPAEKNLHVLLERASATVAPLLSARDYTGIFVQLAALKPAVDAFFEAVMVMADDPDVRANRLALLAQFDSLCREVADLSLLPG